MNITTNTNTNASSYIKAIKVSLNGELRRVAFSPSMSLGTLKQLVTSLFQLSETSSVTLTYVDLDNDEITIGNDDELQIACDECASSALRISASVKPSSSPVEEVTSVNFPPAVSPRVIFATDASEESATDADVTLVTRHEIAADFKRKLAELKSQFPMQGKFTPEQRVAFREARKRLVAEKTKRLQVLNTSRTVSTDLAGDSKNFVSQKALSMNIRRDFQASLAELRSQFPKGKFSHDQRDAFREAKVALVADRDSLLAQVHESSSVHKAVEAISHPIDADELLTSAKSVRLNFRAKLAALREAYPRGKFSEEQRNAFREAKNALIAERDLSLTRFPEVENPVKTIKVDFRAKLRALQSQFAEDTSKFVREKLSVDDAEAFTEAYAVLVQERNLKLRDLHVARQDRKRSQRHSDDIDTDEHHQQRWRGRRQRFRVAHDLDSKENNHHQRARGRRHHHCKKHFQQKSHDSNDSKTTRKITKLEHKLAYFKQLRQVQLARD